MIKFIFLTIPFIFVIFFFFLKKRRKSISFEIRYGLKCYSCMEDLTEDGDYFLGSHSKEEIKICKVCNREEKFNTLHDKFNVNRVKRFLLSKKSEKFQNIILMLSIVFIAIDATLIYRYNIRWFWIFNSIANLIFWLIFFLRYYVTTIKKPSN